MHFYCESLIAYKRLKTREVTVGNLLLGNGHPIRVQTMTTTDTMDTKATVAQTIRCINAGAELVRITAPSKTEAENLALIKAELNRQGYHTPLIADIHFTPNAAEIAARIIEKVRVNPGNYVDKKKFETIEYSDTEYAEEIERIRDRFTPLVKICREYGTAMRIGTNHGSLSDRIMSRYGDTAMGMVESAMEFLRIARYENYHNIVLSMKSSNPQVMVHAYRLLVKEMHEEFGELYPLHLGVTEAGDGEDGRIKSAVGIGTLLEDGIGDTIRVSLTEDPEQEIPVCQDILKRYSASRLNLSLQDAPPEISRSDSDLHRIEKPAIPYSPFEYKRRESFIVNDIGGKHVPCVIADLSKVKSVTPAALLSVGYTYEPITDKWHIADTAADYIFIGNGQIHFPLPGILKVIVYADAWQEVADKSTYFPIYDERGYTNATHRSSLLNFVMLEPFSEEEGDADLLHQLGKDKTVVLCLSSMRINAMQSVRQMLVTLMNRKIKNPVVLITDSNWQTADEHLVHYATETGALLLDGLGDGVCLGMTTESYNQLHTTIDGTEVKGRTYLQTASAEALMNNTAFGILQATRTRISKTDYISCPSCGRTLFDLQETTARIRAVTHHLKGVKIAIMGCIVNGPGEMADADFGYVGSGPGKITLYKSKEVVKRNVPSDVAVDELIQLMKESGAWVEKTSL
ncbi:MAG: (E)-4-hydroxy-3-methylbut-2-enyl-diphosphate synthase [Chitinophagaceae bacterium]